VTQSDIIVAADLPRSVRSAIGDAAQKHGLADPVESATIICRTSSETPKRRFGRGPEKRDTYVVLTDKHLLFVSGGAEPVATVWTREGSEGRRVTERLKAQNFTGIAFTGFRVLGAERENIFIPLGTDPAGDQVAAIMSELID
jgi:hypothetical protein